MRTDSLQTCTYPSTTSNFSHKQAAQSREPQHVTADQWGTWGCHARYGNMETASKDETCTDVHAHCEREKRKETHIVIVYIGWEEHTKHTLITKKSTVMNVPLQRQRPSSLETVQQKNRRTNMQYHTRGIVVLPHAITGVSLLSVEGRILECR